jgi:predicted Ser/Thr protein kinase
VIESGIEVAGYRIERVIGQGGMGVVYEATQLALDRPVALKVLPLGGASDAVRERFRREAMLQAALEHPNVVPVYEAGTGDAGLFIAMKLVRGADLKRLSEGGTLDPQRAFDLLSQAAAALDAAHSVGLVHRDVKPQNILVDESGHVYLADFGLTKGAGERGLTATGSYTGSLDYAAPEQIRGETFGPPADVYAFAAVLYEALTGRVVFPHDTEAALLYAHLSEAPPSVLALRPDLPAALDSVIARGLAKAPGERYASASELVAAARAALDAPSTAPAERPFSATMVDAPIAVSRPVVAIEEPRAFPWRTLGVVLVALVALLVGGWALGRATAGSGVAQSTAQAGPISLTFPSHAWRPARPPAIAGLTLDGPLALVSTDPAHPGTLVAGVARAAEGPGLLPATLQRELTAAAHGQPVQAGRYRGIEYTDLPAANVGRRLSLLLVPTTNGAVAIGCLAPRVLPEHTTVADCNGVAATLRLSGLQALPLGQTGSYQQALSAVLTLLDGERLAGRRQLAGARTPGEQSRAAGVVQAAYASAASRVGAITPSPFARPAQASLVTTLRRAATAYGTLTRAATSGDQNAYDAASKQVDAADRAVDAAITRLAQLAPG